MSRPTLRSSTRSSPRSFPLLASRRLSAFLLGSLLLLTACVETPTANEAAEGSLPSAAAEDSFDQPPEDARGLVVWESRRGERWRLWRRDLDGSVPVPLTPDERSEAHCCAHISPDGRRLVYLALPTTEAEYPAGGAAGELRLLGLAPPGETRPAETGRVLATTARTYFEHRAAVWKNERELIYIDGDGRSVLLDVDDTLEDTVAPRKPEPLTTRSLDAHGWLIDPTLEHATTGTPTFSDYDADARRVRERPSLGGCQPYFSHDGRLGVWVAGAGGPIRAMDLDSRRQWTVVGKGDPRIPADAGYLYFPMPSPDGRFIAWAASDGAHDHTRADYDVYVAETDSETLELVGRPWRVTYDAATDRFPAVWAAPLGLGRWSGEAPLTLRLAVPSEDREDGDWTWSFGDGETAEGVAVEHTWTATGRFEVTASRAARGEDGGQDGGEDGAEDAGEILRGVVRVRPAAPPEILSAELHQGGAELWIRFDEPVTVDGAALELEGAAVASTRLESDGTLWVAELAAPLDRAAELVVRRVADRRQPPNVLEEARRTISPPRWPSREEGLVFRWRTAKHPNRVFVGDAEAENSEYTTVLDPVGRAWTDRHGVMVLRGGAFQADDETGGRFFRGVRATNELTLELTLEAARPSPVPGAIFASAAGSRRNLILSQEQDRLKLRLRTPSTGPRAESPVVDLGPVEAGRTTHVVVSYTPGRLRAFVDGEERVETDAVREGFFHWKPTYLRLGGLGPPAGDASVVPRPWHGRLEGIAVYDRAMDAEEAKENHRRYADVLERRAAVPTARVRAALRVRSHTPELGEIAPYREALAVFEYHLEEIADGAGALEGKEPGDVVRVVHRVLLDGEVLPIAGLDAGARVELELEPFDAQPQLESLFLSDDLPADPKKRLWWSDRVEP